MNPIHAAVFRDESNKDCVIHNVDLVRGVWDKWQGECTSFTASTEYIVNVRETINVEFEEYKFGVHSLTIITTNLEKFNSNYVELKSLVLEKNIKYFYILLPQDINLLGGNATWVRIRDITVICAMIDNSENIIQNRVIATIFIGDDNEDNYRRIEREMSNACMILGKGNVFFTIINDQMIINVDNKDQKHMDRFMACLHNGGPIYSFTGIRSWQYKLIV